MRSIKRYRFLRRTWTHGCAAVFAYARRECDFVVHQRGNGAVQGRVYARV